MDYVSRARALEGEMSIQHASNRYPVVWEHNLCSGSKDYAPRSPSVSRETLLNTLALIFYLLCFRFTVHKLTRSHAPNRQLFEVLRGAKPSQPGSSFP